MIVPYNSLPCIGLDPADKKLILFLPQIKALVTLESTISNTCIPTRRESIWTGLRMAFQRHYPR